jgi:hypothetical protein
LLILLLACPLSLLALLSQACLLDCGNLLRVGQWQCGNLLHQITSLLGSWLTRRHLLRWCLWCSLRLRRLVSSLSALLHSCFGRAGNSCHCCGCSRLWLCRSRLLRQRLLGLVCRLGTLLRLL